ncbi:MAG: UDP-glucose/GDP-mannose dehydrogenase family protein [Candidatus Eremiobacteraeota bacterium]|nr:UDP-glucose/GDP-mannose dehydrogenase family protein [Candidatus Eremiobacteraeota bacterium]
MAKICVIGTGYVGMATMIGLAELGHTVNGHDIASERINKLRLGIPPYHEDGIEAFLNTHIGAGNLNFYEDLTRALTGVQFIVITVGTPANSDGSADLLALECVVQALAATNLATKPIVVLRCTVPPGTSDTLAGLLGGRAALIYAPEFLREGSAVHDYLNPDRIIIGAASPSDASEYRKLFESLRKPVLVTTRCNAELIKSFSNAFLALKISFANEVANICDVVGGTADDVLLGVGYDHRIGHHFLHPGIGFGGPCLEKDTRSIEHMAAQNGATSELFTAALRVNTDQPRHVVDNLEKELGGLAGMTIGVWGLAFKAGTDDVRDSLALRVLHQLSLRGAAALVYDPAVHVAALPQHCHFASGPEEAAHADALLVLTDWPLFATIDPKEVALRLRNPVVVDGRNVLDGESYAAAGLNYRGVGRRFPAQNVRLEATYVHMEVVEA